jgi:hypothetical protein
MFRIMNDFKTYPQRVKTGLVLLLISWVWFFSAMQFFLKIEISTRELVAGAGVVVLAGTMKNWARWLCIMCNLMAILNCVAYALDIQRISQEGGFSVLSTALIISAVLFALSTYYLSTKSSSDFYKAYNRIEAK